MAKQSDRCPTCGEVGKCPYLPGTPGCARPVPFIGCCVCLNLTGVRQPAVVVPGARYQACADHRAMVDDPAFDVDSLRKRMRAV